MKKFIIFFLIFSFFSFPVYALDENKTNSDVESLYRYIDEMKSEYQVLNEMDFRTIVSSYMNKKDGFSFKNLSKGILVYINKEIVGSFKDLSILIVICILFSLLTLIENSFNNENVSSAAYYLCYLVVIIFLFKIFVSCSGLAVDTIKKCSDFMTALIPVMLVLLASVGSFSQAALLDPLIIGGINIFTLVILRFIIPLTMISFAMEFVNGISKEFSIDNLNKLIKQIIIWTMVGIMTIFIGILTIKGLSSKTLDLVTAKTFKFAVDSFIPIVGGCLSDAVTAVASYALVLKGAVGLIGFIVVIVITVFPIIKLIVIALMFKLTAAIVEPISDGKITDLISKTSDSLIILLASLISVSVMFFILIAIISATGRAITG
ncbi:MAG: stage III sporulation protein AE [Clostridiaceae bacterium]